MIYQTSALVLNQFMYDDNKLIIKMYTEQMGTVSYLAYKSKDRKKRSQIPLSMSLVEVLGEEKRKGHLHYIKEVKLLEKEEQEHFDLAKSSVCMFLNEILYRLLVDIGEDGRLFEFLYASLSAFIHRDFTPDFHLHFLIALMQELGFSPQNNYSPATPIFNVESSHFEPILHEDSEQQLLSRLFFDLLNQPLFPEKSTKTISSHWRNKLLDMILKYYTLHIADFSTIKSHEILKTVLH
ncbi:MAG: DNA repair protein RecO [Lentimicrobiaceae bacterium]|nr:DNA repair protein RecO [Lentimicrobiaceae bacterium]